MVGCHACPYQGPWHPTSPLSRQQPDAAAVYADVSLLQFDDVTTLSVFVFLGCLATTVLKRSGRGTCRCRLVRNLGHADHYFAATEADNIVRINYLDHVDRRGGARRVCFGAS